MDFISFVAFAPEILLLLLGCGVAVSELWQPGGGEGGGERRIAYRLSLLTLVLVLGVLVWYLAGGIAALLGVDQLTIYAFHNMAVHDPLAHVLKGFAALATLVALIYGRPYAQQRGMAEGSELYTLALFALLGIFIMISGNNFLVLYLGLELLTLSCYALVALRRDHLPASEAAMKYFVLGAMASGFLLYGLSMLYGATGSLELGEVARAVATGNIKYPVLVFALVFVVAGLAFKLGAAPFHMWVPDVYQGAPTVVTLLIAAAPKLAAFALCMRLLVEGLLPLAKDWQAMLAVLAVASLVVGNLAAIAQSNLKRMLAYSTIGQMGFVLLALVAGVVGTSTGYGINAYSAAMFYMLTYVLTTLAGFGVILLMAREGFESEEIADLAGLNQRSPLYAGVMAACLFSLAGVPPLVGFYAKLTVLQALVVTGQSFYIGLAVFAVMMSLVAAFYYIRVVKVMYFDAPLTATRVQAPLVVRSTLALNGLLVLVLGILPGALMQLCARAIKDMLGG